MGMGSDGARRPRADVTHVTQRAAVERIPLTVTAVELWTSCELIINSPFVLSPTRFKHDAVPGGWTLCNTGAKNKHTDIFTGSRRVGNRLKEVFSRTRFRCIKQLYFLCVNNRNVTDQRA